MTPLLLAVLLQLRVAVPVEKIADRMVTHATWIYGTHSADLLSTGWALHRCPSCYEGNQLGPNVEARLALKMGGTAAALGVCYWLERKGHRDWAAGIRWGTVAVNLVVTGVNTAHAIRKR